MASIDNPAYWRQRAEECRTIAEQINDKLTRDMMLRIAKDYEIVARRCELRLVGKLPPARE